jgi:[ribosomal protein S5]-alanine N-acetyltransferase
MVATNDSTGVLSKCGFKAVGEVVDPADGVIWRWETTGSLRKAE